jgi:4-hydroxy-tetrahydrodipicolinate synthase
MKNQILWTALVTPFSDDTKTIDYESLERLVRLQEQAGNGIVLLGSTGESLSLSDHERRRLTKFVVELKPQCQVLVGVPSYNLEVACNWLNFCNDLPIDGYLITTPLYTKAGIAGQSAWFETLLNLSAHKAMLYNIPGRVGAKLYTETVKNLCDHKNFWAIKDSTGIVDSLVEYRMAVPSILIYCGDDYLMPAASAAGAAGLVSVLSNAWALSTRAYVNVAMHNNNKLTNLWWQAGKAVSSTSNPVPIKALLKDIGLINSDQPRLPLSIDDLSSRKLLLDLHHELNSWRGE